MLHLQVAIPQILTHINDSTPSDYTFENCSQSLGKFLKRSFVSNEIEKVLRLVIAGQVFPDLAAQLHRAVYGLNTQQVNAAQDEREDRRAEIRPPGVATCGDGATIPGRTQEICQRGAANGIYAAGPALFLQGAIALGCCLLTSQDIVGPQFFEVGMLRLLARTGCHCISQIFEDTDRDAPQSSSCARDQHRSVLRLETVVLQLIYRQASGEASRTQGHRLFEGQASRQRHHPIGFDAGIFAEPSIMGDAQFIAGGNHFVAGFEARITGFDHHSRQVNAGHERIATDNFAFWDRCQAILVVHARVGDLDQHLTRGQISLSYILEGSGKTFFLFIDNKCFECSWHLSQPPISDSRLSFCKRRPAPGSTVGSSKRRSSVKAVAVAAERTGKPNSASVGSINGSDGICTQAERLRASAFVRSSVRAAARIRSPGMRATAALSGSSSATQSVTSICSASM